MDTPSGTSAPATAGQAVYGLRRVVIRARAGGAGARGGRGGGGFLAPLNLWPLAVLCPALLMWLWQDATPREAARVFGFCFNAATFTAGTYWLYISIHAFGGAPIWLAFVLMLGLVGRTRASITRHLAMRARAGCRKAGRGALAHRAAGELAARGVVARLVPVGFLVAVARLLADRLVARRLRTARRRLWHQCAVARERRSRGGAWLLGTRRTRLIAAIALIVPWLAGAALRHVSWTHVSGAPVSAAVIQGDSAGTEVA